MPSDALRAIAQAAVSIAAERDRLVKAFDSLRTTVQALDPSAELQDDGNITVASMPLPGGPKAPEPVPPAPAEPPPARAAKPPPRAVAPPVSKPPAPVERPGIDPERGLARSPKPRSEMRSHQSKREERLDEVVQYVLRQEGHKTNPLDAAEDLGITKDRSTADFRELEERGVFRRTRNVHSRKALALPPIKRGRQTIEYTYIHVGNGPTKEEKPSSRPKVTPVTQEQVRDAGVSLGEFNVRELMVKLGVDEGQRGNIVRALETFVNRGTFNRTMKGWKLAKPVDPGAAAQYDATAARGSGTRQDISPVSGTGRQAKSGNKEVNEMLNAARRQWPGSVEQSGDKHWKIKLPPGSAVPFVRIANSPGSAKSLNSDKVKLRKAGLQGI